MKAKILFCLGAGVRQFGCGHSVNFTLVPSLIGRYRCPRKWTLNELLLSWRGLVISEGHRGWRQLDMVETLVPPPVRDQTGHGASEPLSDLRGEGSRSLPHGVSMRMKWDEERKS